MYNTSQGVFYNGVQTVSPAGSGNASNGLSVDPVSGDYVLGNDYGDINAPARLLNDREILTDGFGIALTEVVTDVNSQTILGGGVIQMQCDAADAVSIDMNAGGTGNFGIIVTDTQVDLQTGLFGSFNFASIRQSDGKVQFGATAVSLNNADLQMSGTMTYRLLPQSQSSGTITIDPNTDGAKVISNNNGTALVTINLPNLLVNFTPGFHLHFIVTDADGIRITAFSGARINIGGVQTATGGSVTSTLVGSTLHLIHGSPNTWYALSYTGSWNI